MYTRTTTHPDTLEFSTPERGALDTDTADMIGHAHEASHETRGRGGDETDEAELAEEMERIREVSPEGRPAHPELRSRNLLIMLGMSVGAFVLLSMVVYLFYGLAPAALVLVFGTALACFGNPVFWSVLLRAKEREELEHEDGRDG